MNRIVKVKKTKLEGTDRLVQIEKFENDISENNLFTLPNIETIPLEGAEILAMQTDKRGDEAVSLVPLETEIEPGETRLKWTDADGNVEGYLHLKSGGKVQLSNTTEELITILSDLIQELISAKTVTALGPSPFTPPTVVALTNVKTRLDTFKE